MFNLVIDAGHGGKDPGAIGNGLREKDINLNVALLLKEKLKKYNKDIKVVLTRENDTFLELNERVVISNNNKADLFLSIHCNSAASNIAQGVETYCYNLSNNKGASLIHNHLIKDGLYTKDRKVKQGNFYVVKNTKAHAVLCELGFISNSEDAKILKNKQNDIAEAILKGVLDYFNINYQEEIKEPSEAKLWRVCLGTYSDIENARKVKQEAISKGFKDVFIVEK